MMISILPPLTTGSLTLLLVALGAYLLGSVPFGLVITRLLGLGDLRQIGSGNIGATNVLRTGNKGAALATLLLDAGKGGAAVLIARALTGAEDAAQLAGFAAFLGHIYPVWLRFQGGKGVATFLGTLLALAWPIGLAACASWLVTALITRISSLAALVAATAVPLWTWAFGLDPMILLGAVLASIVIWRHNTNIQRMVAGTEPKIGKK